MNASEDTEPTGSTASWLAGHCQALAGGSRDPAPSIGDINSWYLGYDVGTRDREEGDDVDYPVTPI